MQEYQVLDPDWDNQTPTPIKAETPADAVRKFYTETLLEPAPELYAERCAPNHGTAQHGAIGDTRIPRFYVTDGDNVEYVVYFD